MLRILLGVCFFISPAMVIGMQAHSSFTHQISFPVEKFKLDNGMVVLVYEDPSAPLISFHQWYRVGSRNEIYGRTGLAHFFEHLMFKGSKKYPDVNSVINENGGDNNAFTSNDYTGYYENMPRETEELILSMEADRMRNLIFKQSEIDSEREVVKEERRMRIENSINGTLREAIYASVFKVHPYKWPVIGSMRDLNAASMEDMKAFYQSYYAPNNSILVVGGDISIPEVKKLIHKYYAHIPAQPLPKHKIPMEPEQQAPRKITLKKDVQAVTFAYAYKGTSVGTDDSYALDLLAAILGSGKSSRLHRLLVRTSKLATSALSYSHAGKDPDLFVVYVSMRPEQSVRRAKKIIRQQIDIARTQPVTDRELQKAKNQIISQYVHSLQSISQKAYFLAWYEVMFGDYTQMFRDIDRYQKVTREQILEVAKKYLKPSRASFVQVVSQLGG